MGDLWALGFTAPVKGHAGVKNKQRKDDVLRWDFCRHVACDWVRLATVCVGGQQEQALSGQAHLAELRGIFIFSLCVFSLSEVMKCRSQH